VVVAAASMVGRLRKDEAIPCGEQSVT
jgi:hypothetical protein